MRENASSVSVKDRPMLAKSLTFFGKDILTNIGQMVDLDDNWRFDYFTGS